MPHSKHQRGNRNVHEDVHNNNYNFQGNHVNNPRDMGDQNHQNGENAGARLQHCCVPTGCSDDLIDPADPYNAVKVVCNNDGCSEGTWMHKSCFSEWEQSVLSFLRSCGRARSWSEKQRLQNLWTKKGYDLAYKACDCKCGRGHLRKDLDYFPPPVDNAKKVRKNKKKNDKPMPVVSTNHKSSHYNNQHQNQQGGLDNHHYNSPTHHVDNGSKAQKKEVSSVMANSATTVSPMNGKRHGAENRINNNPGSSATISKTTTIKPRSRNNSLNQNEVTADNEVTDNSIHNSMNSLSLSICQHPTQGIPSHRLRTNSMSSTGSVGSQASSSGSMLSSTGSPSPLSCSPVNGNLFFKGKKTDALDVSQPGIFRRRQDLSAFSVLPRYKQNPYNIHIEDVQEDEETRNFVLNSLTTKRMTALRCVLCKTQLPVFDRFPLVDGTLFLSPQAYDQFVVQVIWEGRIQFLNAVCISCLEGASEAKCSSCKTKWDGSSFVVGTMYTYDVFAAMPCCQKRLTCKHCRRAVIDASVGLDFYSQYSRMIICPYCKANDYHFIRSLPDTFTVKEPICGEC